MLRPGDRVMCTGDSITDMGRARPVGVSPVSRTDEPQGLLKPGDRILATGASFTDMGRAHPVGTSEEGTLGNGWVAFAHRRWCETCPDLDLTVLNTGISGNTTRDLKARFARDVLAYQPDVVIMLIGINDVWRQFGGTETLPDAVMPDEYRANLTEMVTQAQTVAREVLLVSPFYLHPDPKEPMRARMDEYTQIVREVAEATGAHFVDAQAMFNDLMTRTEATEIAADRVHAGDFGHEAVAEAVVAALT